MSEGICSYVNCDNRAYLAVVVGGSRYPLCKRHYRLLVNRLVRLALKHGTSSLDGFEIKKERGKVRFVRRRKQGARLT